MADLRFTKNNDTQEYVAEVVVNADFNIHLERVSNGGLKIYQKNGEYAEAVDGRTATERGFDMVAVPNIIPYNSGIIFDYDFSALVYPKTIRIESGSEVLSGEDINLKKIILEASKGAIAGTGAGLLVTATSNGLIDSTGNAIEKIN